MSIKKCKFCETRMSKVVYGMYVPDDPAVSDPFTEFRGCIVMEPAEDWRCSHCDSKIIPRLTSKSGVCLDEAPLQLNTALKLFASRINAIAEEHYFGKDEDSQQAASLKCEAYNKFGEFDWPGEDPEFRPELGQQHKQRGDFLWIRVCPSLEWQIYFDGSSQVVMANGAEKMFKQPQVVNEIGFPLFTKLHTKLDELVTGQAILHEVIKGILSIQTTCVSESCDHDKKGLWEDLQLLDATLREPNSRLSAHFPSVTAPHANTKENA